MDPATPYGDDESLFATAAEMLNHPKDLLTTALARVLKADTAVFDPASGVDEGEAAIYRLASAYVLTQIASDVEMTAENARSWYSDEEDDTDADRPSDRTELLTNGSPALQPVRGIRFEVRHIAQDMGSNAAWVPALGMFIPKTGYTETGVLRGDQVGINGACDIVLQAAGRVVAATHAHAMVITDQGVTLGLDRHVGDYRESPDE